MTVRCVAASAAILTVLGAGAALAQPVAPATGFEPVPGAGMLSTQSCLREGGQPAYMNGQGYCVLSGRSAVAGPPPAPVAVAPAYAGAEGGAMMPESTGMMTEGACDSQGGRIAYRNGRSYCMLPGAGQ